jgi:predicted dehydrogenase
MSAGEPIGIGLVGVGRWGRNYVRTINALAGCRLVAAADPRTMPGLGPDITLYHDYRLLLDDEQVSAVVVATPDESHFQVAAAALQSGKDVLVEKPMALRTDRAVELAETAAVLARVLAVGHTMLYHVGFAALRRAVLLGRVGAVQQVVAARTSRGAPGRASVISDLVPHDLAMAISLLGEPVAVRARSAGADAVSYRLQFCEDVVASGWAAWSQLLRVRRFRVRGGAGTRVFRDEESLGQRGDCRTQHARRGWQGGGSGGRRTAEAASDVRRTALGRQVIDFCRCCATRREPLSSARLGVAVTRSMNCLLASLERGGSWVENGAASRASAVVVRRLADGEVRAQ